jgi:uncharacterized protein YxeA
MKKISILLLALVVTITSFAQTFDRAYKLQVGRFNKYNETWKWDEPMDVDLLFTLEKSYLKIHDEYGTRLWTYEDLGEKIDYDKDGDKFIKHTWRAYDEKNRKCNFVMLFYYNISLQVYTIQYNDMAFRYYIKKDSE